MHRLLTRVLTVRVPLVTPGVCLVTPSVPIRLETPSVRVRPVTPGVPLRLITESVPVLILPRSRA